MPKAQKALRLCLILTDLFICALVIVALLLPIGVSWYVEVMHRPQSLPATIMVTCYPCAPILGIALIMLRKIIKRISADDIFCTDNSKGFKIIAACCLVIAVITLIAGRFYLPFYIVSGTFIFLALVAYTMRAVFLTLSDRYGEKDTEKQ
ncbi:MAG: DUF2975 domain-containing protein [Acutalibacteraceae bacterium]|nr:DUF2975 domain-containing protein [Acutalibacteraceae bacterium]